MATETPQKSLIPIILFAAITLINLFSFISSFFIIKSLNKLIERSFDLSIIFVLIVCNFAYHLPAMVNMWDYSATLFDVKFIIVVFSLSWACVMSQMSHKAAVEGCLPRSDRYPKIVLTGAACLVLSAAWVLIVNALHSSWAGISLTIFILMMVTIVYYVKNVRFLKQATNPFITNITSKVMTWNLYLLVQAIFMGLGTVIQNSCFEVIIKDYVKAETHAGTGAFIGFIIGGTLSGLTGFVNGVLYKSGDKDGYFRRSTSLLGFNPSNLSTNSVNNSVDGGYSLM